jgi:hypothetical protein
VRLSATTRRFLLAGVLALGAFAKAPALQSPLVLDDLIFRDSPLPLGEPTSLPDLVATVVRVDPRGQPTTIHYEFDAGLDDPNVVWISEGANGYSEVAPPPVGFGVHIAP